MKVVRIEIHEIDIPFKIKFSHSLKERTSSESIIVKVVLDSGHAGYGEGLPREYVTGETVSSAVKKIISEFVPAVLNRNFKNAEEALSFISDTERAFPSLSGAARCAAETAFLDAIARAAGKPLSDLLGGRKREKVFYTGVVSSGDIFKIIKYGILYRLGGFKYVKLKVGFPDDLKNLKILRTVLGKNVDIRVDANCAWSLKEAEEKISELKRFGVRAVEQPLAAGDIEGMKKLTRESGVLIIADESLTTVSDARRLAAEKACSMFNIRVSKCGGIFNSLKIYEIAKRSGIKCQLGCQVGETSILSAAGRHLALLWDDVDYVEGSYGKFLLKSDITKSPVQLGYRGAGRPIRSIGNGIEVDAAGLLSVSKRKLLKE